MMMMWIRAELGRLQSKPSGRVKPAPIGGGKICDNRIFFFAIIIDYYLFMMSGISENSYLSHEIQKKKTRLFWAAFVSI